MLVDLAFKFRIYPTREQASLISKTFGCKRFTWNVMLDERVTWYREHGASIGGARKTEREWKAIHPFLKEVDAIALQQARIDLDTAHDRYFKHLSRKPRFKSRRGPQSYRTVRVGNNVEIDFAARAIKLPKLGWVSFRDDRIFTERPRRVTVSKTKSGRYFAAIGIQRELDATEATEVHEDRVAGIDMSCASFVVGTGIVTTNPRCYRNEESKLKRLHRRVSRKVKGSRNRNKARVKLARLYDRIGNRRDDFLQKLSTGLATRFDAVAVENLNIDGMKRWNGGVAKTVTLDFAWSAFVRMLQYKLDWRDKLLVKVDRFYPSSQLCSECGYQNRELTIDQREWTCPGCGSHHDRDANAASNITREGLRLLREQGITVISSDTTAGTAGSHARGDPVRPVNLTARVVEPGIPRL